MRQTDSTITSLKSAIQRLKEKGFIKIYSGFFPSVIGSMFSSGIYFGTYEYSKSLITKYFNQTLTRPLINAFAAVSGNILSSLIFVPKDALKQQLQYIQINPALSRESLLTLITRIYRESGIKGFYPSYQATILRNIPSAIIRFVLYEEFKYYSTHYAGGDTGSDMRYRSVLLLLSGAIASSISSGMTTPLDVVKTRMATGMLPKGTSVYTALGLIARNEGYLALYKGTQARMLWSACFGGIGFYTFERCKAALGVNDNRVIKSVTD